MTQELFGRFRAKSDFIKYFNDCLQLYLPPNHMINKGKCVASPVLTRADFLKAVFVNDKELLGINEVQRVNVPLYDELAVGAIWPMVKGDKQFMRYFPDKFPKGRLPDRGYFWNILNTKQPAYVDLLVKHANA
jgi:hypothetical protein